MAVAHHPCPQGRAAAGCGRDLRPRDELAAGDDFELVHEHTSSKPAIMQVISGAGTFGFGSEVHEVGPSSWAHMAPSVPHTVTARTRLVFLLTMLEQAG